MTSLITRTSPAPFETVCARLPDAAAKQKFGVLGVHDLREKMRSKGVAFDRECRVFEVCNPQQAQVILTANMAVAAALPCRISAYAEAGRTVLVTIEPDALLQLFGDRSPEAGRIAQDVRSALIAIMDEACAA
jgi:uncharacterized protein (DUF302 family)